MSRPSSNPKSRLTMARRHAGLTQQQLSDLSGVSQRLISSIETGIREGSIETYQKLARALGVSVSYLTGEQVKEWQEGGGRADILRDPVAPIGLQELARNVALCELLAIEAEEWSALRAVQLSYALTMDAYLAILHVIRGCRP